MALTALAGLATFLMPVAHASAVSVTTPPSLPAPLLPLPIGPLPLPIGGSVSGGTGGDPIDVTVTGPGSTGIEATLPGVPSVPALPAGPTGSVPAPISSGDPVVTPAPTPATPGGTDDPAVAAPGGGAVALRPSATPVPATHSSAQGARPFLPLSSTRPANVSAAIDAQPADSLLQGVQAFASRVALWAALAAIVFVLQMLVGSAARQRRSARVS
jgi:hypothetical protein